MAVTGKRILRGGRNHNQSGHGQDGNTKNRSSHHRCPFPPQTSVQKLEKTSGCEKTSLSALFLPSVCPLAH
jgi:hypothetical protein